jgi:hypothetical protein
LSFLAICLSSILQCTCFAFYFPGQGHTEAKEETEVYVGQEMAVYHLSSKLGFDGIADLINDEGDGAWSNSEAVGQAWIIVTAGQVS